MGSIVQFLLRLPPDLKAELALLAAANERSLNSEIVWRLRQSVGGYRQL